MQSIHAVGGLDGCGPVAGEKNEPVLHAQWEAHRRAVDARRLTKLHADCVDEARHRIERMPPVYDVGASYDHIWLLRLEALRREQGSVTEEEVQAKRRAIPPEPPPSPREPYRPIRPSLASPQRSTVIPHAGSANTEEPMPP